MTMVEKPLALASAIALQSHANILLVVDCLSLWLINRQMPVGSSTAAPKYADRYSCRTGVGV